MRSKKNLSLQSPPSSTFRKSRSTLRFPALWFSVFLLSQHAASATLTWIGDIDSSWSSGTGGSNTNWVSNTLPANGDSLVFDLTSSSVVSLTNDLTALTLGGTNAITFNNDALTGTGFTLGGNAITLGGNITSSGITGTHTHDITLSLILSGTRTVTSATGTTIIFDGVISENGGSYGFIKSGTGAATLTGANTFTGALSVNQGTLTVNSIADAGISSALGAGSVINLGSGTTAAGVLTYTGTGGSSNRTVNLAATTTGAATINNNGTGALIFTGTFTNAGTGAKTLTLGGTNTNNSQIQSVLSNGSGTLSLTKNNAGTWQLTAVNTFSGNVSVNQGILSVSSVADAGVASALGAGSVINLGSAAQIGALTYTGAGDSTNRLVSLASTSTGGGTITSSGTGALIFTGAFSNSGSSAKTFTLSGTSTGANEFRPALTDSSGGALTVVKSGAGAWILSGTSSFTGALSVSQGTLTINSLASSGVNSAAGAGSVINLGSGTTVAGTLTYTGSGASTDRTVNLAATTTGGATINSSGSGALVFTGVLSNAGTGTKSLTLGGSYAGGNAIQSAISDGSGTLALTKADAGTWALSGNNTYSGGTTLTTGTLALNSTSAIGTGTLTINGGTLDNTSGSSVTLSTGNAVTLNSSFAFGGSSSLNLGGGAVTLGNINSTVTLNGSGTLTLGELQWNSINGSRVLTVNQASGTGGTLVLGGFQLNTNADIAARNRTITGSGNVTISGAVSNGNAFANGLIYSGSGTLTLTAAATYTGTTTVNGGTLALSGGGSIATASGLAINAGTFDVGGTAAGVVGALTLGAATTTVAGQTMNLVSSQAGGSFTLNGNVTYNVGSTGFENGQATISSNLILAADRTFTVNDSPNASVDLQISGVISGSFALIKANGGTLLLSGTNTYTGQTQLNNGVTAVTALGNIGAASPLGTGDKDGTSGIIRFGNAASTGTLSYLGDGDSTNRPIQIGSGTGATATGGATILSNGTGALIFTATTLNSAVTVSATGPTTARILTLGGTNTNNNTVQGTIANNTGAGTSGTSAVALVKQDAGLWILAGNSSYSGGTTVNGGTLVVNNTSGSATGSGSVIIGNTASLGGSGTAGSLSASASFTEQSGGAIFTGQSGVVDAQTLTLQAGGGFSLSGGIELDLTGGTASGLLNSQAGNNDHLIFSGASVALAGATLALHTSQPVADGAWAAGSSWKLLDWSGVTGTFTNLPDSGLDQGNVSGLPDLTSLGLGWDWSQLYTNGTLSVVALVPEPERAAFLLLGMMFLGLRRRRRF